MAQGKLCSDKTGFSYMPIVISSLDHRETSFAHQILLSTSGSCSDYCLISPGEEILTLTLDWHTYQMTTSLSSLQTFPTFAYRKSILR